MSSPQTTPPRGKAGLLRRGACHRARIRATRWLLARKRNRSCSPPHAHVSQRVAMAQRIAPAPK